jgi:hypothetical protein
MIFCTLFFNRVDFDLAVIGFFMVSRRPPGPGRLLECASLQVYVMAAFP